MSDRPLVPIGENNGSPLVGTSIAFLVLTWISVLLRTYVRALLTKSFLADDWLMLVAQVNFTVSCTFILLGYHFGLGHHDKDLPLSNEIESLKWQALATATYVSNMMFIKLSIAVFLLRLSVQRRYKWILYISMGIIAIWSLALFFWNIFQCSPVEAQWDFTIPNLKCVTSDQVVSAAYALSVMTILTDWLYALLPVPMVWNVKMTKQAKATVIVILGLGVFASVATLIRLKFLADLNDTADILFAGTDAMVWTLVEPGVAIVASSLVTIRPLLRKLRIQGFMSTDYSHSRPTAGSKGGMGGMGGSRTLRSNHKIPGQGPGDLTLIDLETGYDENRLSPKDGGGVITVNRTVATERNRVSGASSSDKIFDGSGTYVVQASSSGSGMDAGNMTPTSAESEVYIIEGPSAARGREANDRQTWSAGRSETSEDITELDAHSQHDGKVGLGVAR